MTNNNELREREAIRMAQVEVLDRIEESQNHYLISEYGNRIGSRDGIKYKNMLREIAAIRKELEG